MKYTNKYLNLISVLFFISHVNFAAADLSSDAETIFNWAEDSFAQYFPSNESTQAFDPWLFRFYPVTSIYVGVNNIDSGVYLLDGEFGDAPLYVDTVQNLLAFIGNNNGGSGDIAACDTTQAPEGIFYTQDGDTVTITTNGQCIQLPETPICNAQPVKEETGISVLTDTDISSTILSGLTFENPDFPNPTDAIVQGLGDSKLCVINAPTEFGAQAVNMDVCYDMTEQIIGAGLQTVPGVVTVNPPVTIAMLGTLTSQIFSDCFATDATTVFDAFTEQIWVLQNGAYVEID